MKPRWHKVLRDFHRNKTRSILAVLAIAIGVSGFGAVLSAYSILIRELNAGYLATNPASATIWTDRIDERITSEIQSFPGIAQVEERRSISARVRTGPGEWRNAVLFIIKDYSNIRISTLQPETGKWPPSNDEILIERDALGVARAKVGDKIFLKMQNGTERSLTVTGSVHDVGQAQARMEQLVYGYITAGTMKLLGEDPFFDQWKIVVNGDKFQEEHVRNTISRLKAFIETKGYSVRRVEIPKPGAHPHADLMGTLLLFKSTFGFFALLLSGVLVLNLMSALIAGQIRQIGIMKTIGAKRIQVMGVFFSSIVLLSLASMVIAVPLAIIGGRFLAIFMSRFLNFDIHSYAISFWVFALEAFAGLLVPLVGALYPVMKGSRISVAEALSDYGIKQKQFGDGWTDRLISHVGGLTRPLLLSIRNTFRRRGRLVLIVMTLATGGGIFIAAWNVRVSLIRTVDVMLSSFRYDMAITFAKPYRVDRLEGIITSTPGVSHVESWSVAEGIPVNVDGKKGDPINLVAPPPNTEMLVLKIVEGRGLRVDDKNALVINNALMRRGAEFSVGRKLLLQIGGQKEEWHIIGLARQPLAGSAAYANPKDLDVLTGQVGLSRNIRVVTDRHDAESVHAVGRNLEKNLAGAGFQATSNVAMVDRRRVIDEHNSVIYTFLVVMALLIVVVGGLGLMTVMSINVLERKREIGVMRAIGAGRRKVLLIILGEGTLIGFLSWFVAVGLSVLISKPLGEIAAGKILRTNLENATDSLSVALWLLIVLLFGAAASFLPAWNASHQTVRELVEYE